LTGIGVKSVMFVIRRERNTIVKISTIFLFISGIFETHVNNIIDFHSCQIIDAKALVKSLNDVFVTDYGYLCRSYTNSCISLQLLFITCHFRILRVSLIIDKFH
jgi:hypothetical protein